MYETAKKFYKDENYKEALKIYDDLYKADNDVTDDFLREYSWCLQERLRYKESIELTTGLLEKNPEDKQSLLNYTICLGKQNYHSEAIAQYEKILELDGAFVEYIGYYAYLLERTGNVKKALIFYKKAIELESDNNWYISHYAFALQKDGQFNEADKYFSTALDKEPGNTWIIKRYAYLKNEMSGKEESYAYYDSLISNDSSNFNHYINYAELLIINGDDNNIVELLNKAAVLDSPLVIKIIINFYFSVFYIIQNNKEELNKYSTEIKNLIKDYKSYIHRDFTDLENYLNDNCSSEQIKSYFNIKKIATNL